MLRTEKMDDPLSRNMKPYARVILACTGINDYNTPRDWLPKGKSTLKVLKQMINVNVQGNWQKGHRNSSKFKFSVRKCAQTGPHRFTLRTSLSQKPPYHGARSMMNCQSTWLFARYCFTSLDLEILLTSTDEDLKVSALSVNNFAGSPIRLTNLRNACRKDVIVKLSVNSRWTARVDAHVNRQQYALLRFSGDAELT